MSRRRYRSGSQPPRQLSAGRGPRSARVAVRLIAGALVTVVGVAAMGVRSAVAAEHKVRPGENLITIARRYGVSSADLARLNHLADPNHLLVGAVLQLPGASREIGAPGAGSSRSAASGATASDRPAGDTAPYFKLPPWQRRAVAKELSRAAIEFGVSSSLLKALTYTESRWRQDVVSGYGAIGVGQLLPDTVAWLAVRMGEPGLDPTVRRDNIRMSAFLLRYLLDHTTSRNAAIASYYQGLRAVQATGVSRGGARYAATIAARRRWFS